MTEAEPIEVKRVFVNDIDRYSSKFIAKFLSRCESGEGSDEEEEEVEADGGEPLFKVVGTVTTPQMEDVRYPIEQIMPASREELLHCLLDCDVVVYNISENSTIQQVDEAEWAYTALCDEMDHFKSRKSFILITSVMTWVMTKPAEVDELGVTFQEKDFRQRRPHPNFRPHYMLERTVLKMPRGKKFKLRCYIVAAGIQYGMGEDIFHYFFKTAWLMQLPEVPIFGEGSNTIPMIHVYDLGSVIKNIIQLKSTPKYLLAIDESRNTLGSIVTMISEFVGPEKVMTYAPGDAIKMEAFQPTELECVSIDLHLEAEIIKDFSISWVSRGGILENMESILTEYKYTRRLLPIKICVVGPPAVGKTTIAKKICRYYQLHYINVKDVIEETISQLEAVVNETLQDTTNEEAMMVAQKQLDTLNKSMQMNQGLLTDEEVANLLQTKLNTRPCLNQGFVLDGYLKTYEQAQMIFMSDVSKDQETDELATKPKYNKVITPEHVLVLQATDDFLMERTKAVRGSDAKDTRYTKENFEPRLSKYRELTETDQTLLDFFDEREIHPDLIDINVDDPDYTNVMKYIIEYLGRPKNYGLTPEIQEEEDRNKEVERLQKKAEDDAIRQARREIGLADMVVEYENWQSNLAEVQRQEAELDEANSLNLRCYLMKYIVPSLIDAMAECSEIRTEDPVDFVAEFLIRKAPQD